MFKNPKIDANGQEYFTMCVKCSVDGRQTCNGKKITLENNHKKNSYSIYESIGSHYIKELQKGKGETLGVKEFEKWLVEHGYIEDEHACAEARKQFKALTEVER